MTYIQGIRDVEHCAAEDPRIPNVVPIFDNSRANTRSSSAIHGRLSEHVFQYRDIWQADSKHDLLI